MCETKLSSADIIIVTPLNSNIIVASQFLRAIRTASIYWKRKVFPRRGGWGGGAKMMALEANGFGS